MTEQLVSVRDNLDEQAKPHKWGDQIRGTLDCIALMARCNLLMSKQSLGTLEIRGKGLQYNSLRANIRHCNQMGLDALRSTTEHMGEVDRLARNMSHTEGIIASIQQNIGLEQSRLRRRNLQDLISLGVSNVEKSVCIIAKVKENFSQWNKVTKNLLFVLEEKTSENKKEEKKIQKEIEWNKSRGKGVRIMIGKTEEASRNLTIALENFKNGYTEHREENPESSEVWSSVAALSNAPGIVGAAFRAAWSWDKDSLEEERRKLDERVNELHNEIESTIGVMGILEQTLIQLSKLQSQVEVFMDFLINIQSIMADVKDTQRRVLMEDLTTEEVDDLNRDRELTRAFNRNVALMQRRFFIASKAASLYNEVSGEFILPGVSWVTGFYFVDASGEVYEKGEVEIQTKEAELCGGAKEFIAQRIEEIGIELKLLDTETTEKTISAKVEEIAEDEAL
ncbi:hypothetical protein NW768_002409 [Fusarium equiseti]|uniref:Uncharacterized protein n=1 Tax=Fusarium equiseti TaxID=61235 RepID=A0ABQ8RNE2_FUSEQ|nr:hypothetical protein NW768_002409 [Fusarium equiseti]